MNPAKVLPWIQLATIVAETAQQVVEETLSDEEIEARWNEVSARALTAGDRWRATRKAKREAGSEPTDA